MTAQEIAMHALTAAIAAALSAAGGVQYGGSVEQVKTIETSQVLSKLVEDYAARAYRAEAELVAYKESHP